MELVALVIAIGLVLWWRERKQTIRLVAEPPPVGRMTVAERDAVLDALDADPRSFADMIDSWETVEQARADLQRVATELAAADDLLWEELVKTAPAGVPSPTHPRAPQRTGRRAINLDG